MKLKKPNHIGIVVRDADQAKEYYGKLMGIKNWYEIVSDKLVITYRGEVRKCDVTLLYGGKGTTKLELIQTRGDENIYTEFLARRGEGIHHIMYNVKNLDASVKEALSEGMSVLQTGTFDSAGAVIRYAYLGKGEDDVILELVETTLFGRLKKGDMPAEMTLGLLTGSYKKRK